MALEVGDVIRIFDNTIAPPDYKRFLCLNVAEGWFFRINSRPHWRPNFPLPFHGNEHCLDHDSFAELRGIIEYIQSEIDDALRYPANHLGKLSEETIRALAAHLPSVITLTPDEKAKIIANLSDAISNP
jgi:hypothetical protein